MTDREYIRRLHEDFKAMERHEMVIYHKSRIQSFGTFILRCLANPKSSGSEEALAAILRAREPEKREV